MWNIFNDILIRQETNFSYNINLDEAILSFNLNEFFCFSYERMVYLNLVNSFSNIRITTSFVKIIEHFLFRSFSLADIKKKFPLVSTKDIEKFFQFLSKKGVIIEAK